MDKSDLELLEKFFEEKELRSLLNKVEEDRKKFENSHFNIFSLVSDQYRKENLHSDILAEFLNPQGRHGQGNVFLMKFIKLINDKAEKQIGNHWRESSDIKLNLDNFKDAKVVREQGRIDILITGLNEAIIFENKINNAGDTRRQLPDYFNLINGKKEFSTIVIVYMPYIQNKFPEEIDWEESDRKNIYPRFVLFNAFEAKNEDALEGLVKNWLQLATMKNYTILYQYSELLKMIGEQVMSDKTNEDIFNFFMDGVHGKDRIKTAFLVHNYITEGLLTHIAKKVKAGIVIPPPDHRNHILKDLRNIGGGFKNQESCYQLTIQNIIFEEVYLIAYIRFYLKETGVNSELVLQTYNDKYDKHQIEVLEKFVTTLLKLGLKQDENYRWRWAKTFQGPKQHEAIIKFVNDMFSQMTQTGDHTKD